MVTTVSTPVRRPLLAAARNVVRFFEAPFTLDLRALAAFRICIGMLSLASVAVHLPDAAALYSDAGILPRELSNRFINLPGSFKLDFLSGSAGFEVALMVLHGLAALSLALGYRTRLATVLCWALALGERERNLLAADGGDDVLVLFLFWGIFLPLGARASLDAIRAEKPERGNVVSIATVGFVFQLFCLYYFAALMKTGPAWRTSGTALYQALSLDMFATPLAVWLRTHRELCRALTLGTFWLEFVGPIILLLPKGNTPIRSAMVFSFIALHLGILATLNIQIFSLTACSAWLALLPTWWWDRFPVPAFFSRVRAALLRFGRAVRPGSSVPIPLWAHSLAAAALALVLLCNVAQLPGSRQQPAWLRFLNQATGLSQQWSMFAPEPVERDGWFVFPATLASGQQVDIFRNAPLSWERPANIPATYRDRLWRNHLTSISVPEFKVFFPPVMEYLCRSWNASHPASEAAEKVEMVFMLEKTRPDDPAPPAEKLPLFQANCAAAAAASGSSSR